MMAFTQFFLEKIAGIGAEPLNLKNVFIQFFTKKLSHGIPYGFAEGIIKMNINKE